MNCPYCNDTLIDPARSGNLNCSKHEVPVTFIYSTLTKNNAYEDYIAYIQFRVKQFYIIEMCYYNYTTRLYVDEEFSMPYRKQITELSYIPKDLTPATAEVWLQRFINLKTFA